MPPGPPQASHTVLPDRQSCAAPIGAAAPAALWHTGRAASQFAVVAAGQERAVPAISTAIPLSHAARWLAFIVLVVGGLLPSVDFFIVNVALPSIHTSLGANPAEVQLVVSGYAASYAVFLITGGRLGDLYGRRRLFMLGMAGFLATNALCGLAITPTQLVIGRILQGVAAAALAPQVLGSVR